MARPRQVSDEQILETARRCFLTHGPGVSTQRIAEQLGVSQPVLFKRFCTKERLLLEALLPPEPDLWRLLEHGPTDAPIRDQLLDVASEITAFLASIMPAIFVLQSAGLSPDKIFARFDVPPPVKTQRAMAQWLQRAKDDGRVELDDPGAVAMAFLGSLNFRIMLVHIDPKSFESYADAGYVRSVVDTFWRAIAPRTKVHG